MKTPTLMTLCLLFAATPALAHGALQAFWGGQITEVGDLRVEFRFLDGGVRAFVRDHADQPRPATGKVVLLADGHKIEAAFRAKDGALIAEAPVKAADKLTAVLSLTVGGAPVSARFTQERVNVPPLGPEAEAGRQIFERVCAKCHGTALRGTDNGPSFLNPVYAQGAGHGDDAFLMAMASGAPGHMWKFGDMPKPEGLVPGDDARILAYIRAMQAANGLAASVGGAIPMDHSGHTGHKM